MYNLLIVADPTDRICAFSKPSAPAPMPVPVAPSSSAQAAEDRQMAQREALQDEARRGVRTNIYAGKGQTEEEVSGQALIGGAKRGKRAVATDMLG
jgi:hypothetical protein